MGEGGGSLTDTCWHRLYIASHIGLILMRRVLFVGSFGMMNSPREGLWVITFENIHLQGHEVLRKALALMVQRDLEGCRYVRGAWAR